MDEQLLRARMHALEMAHMQHGFTTDGYTDAVLSVAAEYEAWLMRGATAHQPPKSHFAETTAGRLGYEYCRTGWRNVYDPREPHVCSHATGHESPHRCACGSECDMP